MNTKQALVALVKYLQHSFIFTNVLDVHRPLVKLVVTY